MTSRKTEAARDAEAAQADLDAVTAAQRPGRASQGAGAPGRRGAETTARLRRTVRPGRAHQEDLKHHEGRVQEILRDAREKLPAYNASRLFRYLYERGYGTNQCRAAGWRRPWIAGWPGSSTTHRRGYEFLRDTPALVGAEVDRRRTMFDQLMEQVAAIQKEEADRLGLTPVLAEGDAVGTERDRLVGRLNALREAIQKIEAERARLDQSQDAFHAEAIQTLRDVLDRTEQRVLIQRASASPDPDDDAIVARLAEATRRLDEIRDRQAALAEERRHAVAVRASLEDLRRRFRQANFDSTRSMFQDDRVLATVLGGIETGRLDASGAELLARRSTSGPLRSRSTTPRESTSLRRIHRTRPDAGLDPGGRGGAERGGDERSPPEWRRRWWCQCRCRMASRARGVTAGAECGAVAAAAEAHGRATVDSPVATASDRRPPARPSGRSGVLG